MHDDYTEYEDRFNARHADRKDRRKRKPRQQPVLKKPQVDTVDAVADTTGLESGFQPTYQPSKYEAGWLLKSLESLYDQQFITDVLAQIKGGKEASVYRCEAHPSTDTDLLAAKVYRPRMFRQLRNDHIYRQGREIIMADGPALNGSDFREMRALAKGTAFGKKLEHTSWLMHEFNTMMRLYEAGAAVPKPYAVGDNVILMSYLGDEDIAAPTLNTVRLDRDEIRPLLEKTLHHIELMLKLGWIHGDLSAFNILYWEGDITLIDFPQVVNVYSNPDAYFILQRDIRRICEYFDRQGAQTDPDAILADIWTRYAGPTPLERLAEETPFLEAEQEEQAAEDEE